MADRDRARERATRLEIFQQYAETFASAPIRLMSRTVGRMRSMGYPDQATAIGDLDWRTVPSDDPEDPTLREEWGNLVSSAYALAGSSLQQLASAPMGYNIDSIGYPAVRRAWAGMWWQQLGLDFDPEAPGTPQLFLFHGGNQAIQAALLGVAERHRERVGTSRPATMLIAIPTFSCPLDQCALQGLNVVLVPPTSADGDPAAVDLEQVADGVDVDGIYIMPVNNPTGRTPAPGRIEAFVAAALDRWPHAGIILDSVYVRLHPRHRELLAWYGKDPRHADAIVIVDSLSKTHGVTGLRAGAVLTRSTSHANGILRYSQNIMAGPSNIVQAVVMGLIGAFATGDAELAAERIRLEVRIGRHLQRRRRLLVAQAFARHRELLDPRQPALPDPVGYDWEGSMYANLRLSEHCLELAREAGVAPTTAFYLETGMGGVPLDGFCTNRNLDRHGLVVNAADPALRPYLTEAARYVRLSFGMVPPPAPSTE